MTAAPSSCAARPTDTSAPRRSSGSRTTPPLPTLSRPTSNWGLTIVRQSNSGVAAAISAGSTLCSEMKDRSATIRSGAVRQGGRIERLHVRALEDRDPLVLAQRPVQLAIGHVGGDHRLRPALEQAVGEPAGGGARVQAPAPGHVEAERVQRVGELHAPARDVLGPLGHLHVDVVGHHPAGLVGHRAPRGQADVPGDHRGRGPRP